MRALITGSRGQLGHALQHCAPAGAVVIATDKDELDITDVAAVGRVVSQAKPDVVFNAAGYTAVDAAEHDAERARLLNATAVGHLAQATKRCGARLVQVSTDFVFDGRASRAYRPDDPPAPLSVYGQTKWEGEAAAGAEALIVRTAWLYAAFGRNFVLTMLKLMAERREIRVVADQIGTPTAVFSLAAALWRLVDRGATGIHHYTDSGVASWYDFAVAIQEEALPLKLLDRAIPVIPIPTSEYPTPARRPAFSVLDKSRTWEVLGAPAPHWRMSLREVLQEVRSRG